MATKEAHAEFVTYASLTKVQQRLLDAAEAGMQKTHNPYSHFAVGAAVITGDGTVISGANYENASYGAAMCAERTTIFTANNLGYKILNSIAIIAKGEGVDTTEPTGPCGLCRQVLYEALRISGNKDIEVILSNTKKDKIIITSVKALVPMPFGPSDLGIKLRKPDR